MSGPSAPEQVTPVGLGEAFRVWLKIGLMSFGGPAGQIALMHRILVDEKRWVEESRFLHALNYCMLLPGPEAQQLATYIGWLLHRTAGGLIAGILFVLPGAFVILALSVLYAGFRDLTLVGAIFFGIKAVVLAIVLEAVIRIAKRALNSAVLIGLAAAAFILVFFFAVPFPIIVIGAGLIGWGLHKVRDKGEGPAPAASRREPVSLGRAARVVAVCGVLWLGPVTILALWLGGSSVFVQEGLFFSKMAVVTFGGAYAVLAYVAQQAVETYGWLSPGEMVDGLGMAETTPGPLIMVVQFVGFMGAYRNPGMLDPMLAGVLGAALTTWVTFVPCFLFIFLGAPYIEALRGNRGLAAALSGITAAIVGVILNLAVWFGLHVIFAQVEETDYGPLRLFVPDIQSLDFAALVLSAAAMIALLRFKIGVMPTIAVAAVLGMAYVYLVP